MPSRLFRKLFRRFAPRIAAHRAGLRRATALAIAGCGLEPLEERRVMATFTWDERRTTCGSSADANWTTATNWLGDVLPDPGDDLVFPAGAAQLTNTNDFAGEHQLRRHPDLRVELQPLRRRGQSRRGRYLPGNCQHVRPELQADRLARDRPVDRHHLHGEAA